MREVAHLYWGESECRPVPEPIYVDHAATTPLRTEAWAAMEPFLLQNHANPSSVYRMAQAARASLDSSRDTVAECLGAGPAEIVFTSGGTESNNAAIKGVALAQTERGGHLVTTAIEHHAVLHPMEELQERFGFDVTIVPVAANGIVDPRAVEKAIRPDTALISVMWANNEIGTVQPIHAIGEIARARRIPFHVDAVQAAGNLDIDLRTAPVDLMSLSAHKFYGPKGAGALFIRRGVPWWPLIGGGGQERNRRAGTENVAGIAGMAAALRLACTERAATTAHLRRLRDYLLREIPARVPGATVNGDVHDRLPNNANFTFRHIHGESLLMALDMAGVMASSGSACSSGSTEPSHVLEAIGRVGDKTDGSLRLTVGRGNTPAEMERVVDKVVHIVARLRDRSRTLERA
ncbi:MAG: cysteine desulfurase NifS [Chloroflexota bacterium]